MSNNITVDSQAKRGVNGDQVTLDLLTIFDRARLVNLSASPDNQLPNNVAVVRLNLLESLRDYIANRSGGGSPK